ncbi:MAG: glycosyltransferase family 4 protein [Candidatus Kuenenbacteria bacterium]
MRRKFKIAIISKLWEETSELSTGGSGMSVGTLVNGLVERGHQVTLFATGNSKSKAQKLVSIKDRPYKGDYSEIKEYQNIYNAFKIADQFDIIHAHVEHKACFFAPLVETPVLVSIRYGGIFKDEVELLMENNNLNYCFNSKILEKKYSFLKSRGVVYNGINLDNYVFNNNPKDYLLFLGRVSPQKGPHLAIRAAKKLNRKLIIAGKTENIDKQYLDKYVWPYIDGKQIIYKGLVGLKEKRRLLSAAYVLLQPNLFFEACSNTILEAQASGTPVVAFDNGSNRDIIKNGKTGFIASERNLVDKIRQVEKIKRSICREWIEKNFSKEKMVDGYEKIYEKILIC